MQFSGEEWALVLYNVGGPRVWHQRRVLGRLACSASQLAILTPDLDGYLERLLEVNEDIAAVRFGTRRWPPPPGVPRDETYRFAREPTRAELGPARPRAAPLHAGRGARCARGRTLAGALGLAVGRAASPVPFDCY